MREAIAAAMSGQAYWPYFSAFYGPTELPIEELAVASLFAAGRFTGSYSDELGV